MDAFTLVVLIIAIALVFDYINGFHDAANSIATIVATRVLTPFQAVVWAAFFNFAAYFIFTTAVAKTVGKNPTFVSAALHGNHRLTPEEAAKVGKLLDLDRETTESLSKFPVRTDFPNTTDPFKYRLMELVGVYGDALRNCMIPVITLIGTEFAFLIGGLVVTETVFTLNGVGRFVVDAVAHRDYPVVQALIFLTAFSFVLVNLLVDLTYAWFDPRIRYR